MQDLVENMGINRASMYQTYGNKHDLFRAAIDHYIASSLNNLTAQLAQPGPALSNLRNLFVGILDQSLRGEINGCFINNSAVEIAPHNSDMAESIRKFWSQFEDLIANTLRRAIDNSELTKPIDTDKVASLLNTALQGMLVKTKASVTRQSLIQDLELLFTQLTS